VGVPFAYPLFRLVSGVAVAAYVHYPVISVDMIQRVASRNALYNNAATVARSRVLTEAKLLYYNMFAWLYRQVGRCVRVPMVNSTWTANHIQALWRLEPVLVFPPCNVREFAQRSLARHGKRRDHAIVSIGQFRPEKNHLLQLQAFALALPRLPADAVLYLVGGARNDEDRSRVAWLQGEAAALGIASRVVFCVSCPFERIAELLATGLCGLHSMLDEHFGIVVVEYLAAGCVPLAHNSGGVAADIVRGDVGRLATTKEEFAEGVVALFELHEHHFEAYAAMQARGAAWAERFADAKFAARFVEALGPVLTQGAL
jgi:alpha-1,2-mannosyltransferase